MAISVHRSQPGAHTVDAGRRTASRMRRFWDDAARRNATWFVDTSLDYSVPDMGRFFDTGRAIVGEALDNAPATPSTAGRAVEIGAGLGRNCLALADRFEEVVGIDISPEMVARARSLVPDPRVSFLLGDGCSLMPLGDASADLVLSFTVFQHIPKVSVIESYLRDAARVLRPGGVVVFQWNSEPGAYWWRARAMLLGALQWTGIHPEQYGRNAAPYLGSRASVDRIRRALESSGLSMRGVRGEGTLFTWGWAQAPW